MPEWIGLTTQEVQERQTRFGLNELPEKTHHPLLHFLQKFWAPVPWMLEGIIILQFSLGKWEQGGMIALLLLVNALITWIEEGRAKHAVKLLRNRLSVQARALRDGTWTTLAAQQLVPDDLVHIRMGDIIAADVQMLQGSLIIDQSAITGESLPLEPSLGTILYAGSITKHGEAHAKVVATGVHTQYGKLAEIMRSSKTPSHFQEVIMKIVRALIIFDVLLISAAFWVCLHVGIPVSELLPFSLLLLVAAVPVALPAMYALATALGSVELSRKGVLVTRLSAIEEAAAMDILCVDKTGTITQNELAVSQFALYPPYLEEDLWSMACACCEEATQDPLDLAILQKQKGSVLLKRLEFTPFDPDTKYSKAIVESDTGVVRLFKGSPVALIDKLHTNPLILKDLANFSACGSRVLAVLKETDLVGLIAFADAVRDTSKEAVQKIHDLGVKIVMITGDTYPSAESIASFVGIGKNEIMAEVLPQDKFHIIRKMQNEGHICGMTGDGVNDAAALKQAEVGIAVSNATDVSRAAASLILTRTGLVDIVEAIESSRSIYQRLLTYTLNKIIKTLEISILLALGLLFAHEFLISQTLIVILLLVNDVATMSLSTDRVSYSLTPNRWHVRKLMKIGALFAICWLLFSFSSYWIGTHLLHLSLEEMRSLIFLILVFSTQATLYLIREHHHHFWHSRPSTWMLSISGTIVVLVSVLAMKGIFMTPLPLSLIITTLGAVILYLVLLDWIKVKTLRRGAFGSHLQ